MRLILSILFILLYLFQSIFLRFIYPDYLIDADVWDSWYYARCQIYEMLFLIGLLIPLFKKNKLGNSFIVLSITLVFFSNVDKLLLGVFDFLHRDKFVYLASIMFSIIYYKYYEWIYGEASNA